MKRPPLRDRKRITSSTHQGEMRRNCKKCREWEKHFYWSHMDQTKVSFCKKMDASSLMKKMDLPNDFNKNFKGQIGETVEMKVLSGNVWQVGVTKSAEKITFQSGWKDFVIANNIEPNDLLVFKFRGNSSFEVQVFDPSGCERTSLFARKEEVAVQASNNSSIKVFEGSVGNMYQDTITISGSSSDSEDGGSVPVIIPRGRASKEAGTSREPNGGCKFKAPHNYEIIFSEKLLLTAAQKKRMMKLSEIIKPGNHCFAILLTHSMLNHFRFVIPAKFSTEHLPHQTKVAKLNYKGRTWSVNIGYRKQIYRCFSGGWKQFVEDNNVQEEDLCLFELMKRGIIAYFQVHISRN